MSKKRVSLTLEERLVDKIDDEASKKGLNRSQTVEEIARKYFESRSIETAVVLCGDPEARSLEKYNEKPVLEHILEHLSGQVSRAILLVGNNTEIEGRFGSSYGELALDYVSEDDPQGTAAALRNVEGMVDRTFAVLNGHVITDVDLQELAGQHREENTLATIALTTVEDPSGYGVARLKGSQILGFEEKPEKGEVPSRLINAGTYLFEPSIFDELGGDSLETVFQDLAGRSQLTGYIYGGEWLDIDKG